MSKNLKPICGIGTELPQGKVVAITKNGVSIETPQGVKQFNFTQTERFINDARTV